MSPLGIQRAIAVIIFLSPWIYIPTVLKEVVFIVAGVLLFISTLDIRKTSKPKETTHHSSSSSESASSEPVPVHPTIPSI